MDAFAAVAAPAYIEMGHFRQFSFDGFDQALDAFMIVTLNDLNIPAVHDVAEDLIVVDEKNGETVLKLLKAAGLETRFTQIWAPVEEIWVRQDGVCVLARELEAA